MFVNPAALRRALPVALAIVLAFLLASAVRPAGAQAFEKAIWGPVTMPDGSSAFPLYSQLGVQEFQIQMPWYRIARKRPAHPTDPNDPAYRWSQGGVDDAVRQGAQYGVNLAVMVTRSPGWANGGQPSYWAPTNPQDYADFLTAAAKRYPSVRKWMIWGEVTSPHDFQPMPANSPIGPTRYAQLLDAAYGALKSQNPANVVIGGMTSTGGDMSPPDFIKWLKLPTGQRPRLDMFGHNPYSHRSLDLSQGPIGKDRDFADIDTLAAEVRAAFPKMRTPGSTWPGPQLWLSEFGVSTDRPNRVFQYYLSRPDQAVRLAQAYWIASQTPYTEALGWFTLLDEPASMSDGLTTGLMTYEGARKPSFDAYSCAPQAVLAPCKQPGQTGGPPSNSAPLTLTVRASRQKLRGLKRHGLRLRIACSERCSGVVTLTSQLRKRKAHGSRAHRVKRLKRRSFTIAGDASHVVVLKLKRRALRTLTLRGRVFRVSVHAHTPEGRKAKVSRRLSWRSKPTRVLILRG